MKFAHLTMLVSLALANAAEAQQFSVRDVQRELIAGSSQLNSTLPMWINRDVRLDTSFPGPGLRLTYVATVMNGPDNTPATVSEINPERIKPGICNDLRRRVLLLNGVVFSYMYRREDLKPLTTLSVSASDCGLTAYR